MLRLPAEDAPHPYFEEQQLPDGRTLKIEHDRMLAFLPSGERDPGFGEEGVTMLVVPSTANTGFPNVVVDPLGRLVVVATWSPEDAEQGRFGDEDAASMILAERFTAMGRFDSSFGGELSLITTDFGLPPAEPGLRPTLRLTGNIVFDADGGMLISGTRTSGVRELKQWGHFRRETEAFVGRIAPLGEVDPYFGVDGGLRMPGFTEAGWLAPLKDGGSLLTYRRDASLFVAKLTDTGLDSGFGEGGLRRVSPWTNPFGVVGLDPGEGLIVSAVAQGSREHHLQNGVALKRLLVTGKLDRAFGRNGLAIFRYPGLYTSGEALDDRGRIVVGMMVRDRERGQIRRERLALARLRPNGKVDHSFGRDGVFRLPLKFGKSTYFEGFTVAGNVATIDFSRCDRGCSDFRARVLLGR